MLLLEHDAKEILAKAGIPVPQAWLASDPNALSHAEISFPCFVKAQVPVGGRGKAGGILKAESKAELEAALSKILRMRIKGHEVRSCRVETPASGHEAYVALMLDPSAGGVRVLLSAAGGMNVEGNAAEGKMLTAAASFDQVSVAKELVALARNISPQLQAAITSAAPLLAEQFFSLEATLLEINPFFVKDDGSWIAGDAKLAVDDNALSRQPALLARLRERAADYPEVMLKLSQGFDFVVLDDGGDIGLVTTGAGLSMQLVDEIGARGHSPFNFCDIRTGQFRGDPSRLIQVLQWIAAGRNVRAVLMNFFAGITHLGELAKIIVTALRAVPELKAPITLRMIGNGYDEAIEVLAKSGLPVRVEPDLERALAETLGNAERARP